MVDAKSDVLFPIDVLFPVTEPVVPAGSDDEPEPVVPDDELPWALIYDTIPEAIAAIRNIAAKAPAKIKLFFMVKSTVITIFITYIHQITFTIYHIIPQYKYHF